jgi:hypothetical protein
VLDLTGTESEKYKFKRKQGNDTCIDTWVKFQVRRHNSQDTLALFVDLLPGMRFILQLSSFKLSQPRRLNNWSIKFRLKLTVFRAGHPQLAAVLTRQYLNALL